MKLLETTIIYLSVAIYTLVLPMLIVYIGTKEAVVLDKIKKLIYFQLVISVMYFFICFGPTSQI